VTTETKPDEKKDEKKEKPEIKDHLIITQHAVTIGGQESSTPSPPARWC
jgi:hypothetical protein